MQDVETGRWLAPVDRYPSEHRRGVTVPGRGRSRSSSGDDSGPLRVPVRDEAAPEG